MSKAKSKAAEGTASPSASPIPEKHLPEEAKQWKWRTRKATLKNGIRVRVHETVSERKKSA